MRLPFLLDVHGDAPVPTGYYPVASEAEFLLRALGEEPILVRGHALCRWAREFCEARDYLCEDRESPAIELLQAYPELGDLQAQRLTRWLGEQWTMLPRPLELTRIAAVLWPNELWEADLDSRHAAYWLLWLVDPEVEKPELALLKAIASGWAARVSNPESEAYSAVDKERAWDLLKEWLRVNASDRDWPLFPDIDVPASVFRKMRSDWRAETVASRGRFFSELADRSPRKEILQAAARIIAEFYLNNPEELSGEERERLRPYLSRETDMALRNILPPREPGEPPEDPDALVEWFRNVYLPYRTWQVWYGQEQHHERVKELCRGFGLRYLSLYARASAGGAGAERLNWAKAASISQDHSNDITLMIVLDGLGYDDAEVLLNAIGDYSDRLSVDSRNVALAPLPTITLFAKPALLTGVQPQYASDQERLGSLYTKDVQIIEALSEAKPGELKIWSLLEPDKTYHAHQDRETIVQEVSGRLQSLGSRIAKVAHAVPHEQRLKVVLCTDHGRLLDVSRRAQPVPSGMKPHGRAAWGELKQGSPPEGFVIEKDIVYLHPDRFGLAQPCAVVLSGESFLTSDGKTGNESFPHGGLYPEEVLIPWLELTRDRDPLNLQAVLSGRGVAGAHGRLSLRVDNLSDLPVRLLQLEISGRDLRMDIDQLVGPMSFREVEQDWAPWPSSRDLAELRATLRYSLPAGKEHVVVIEPSLDSEELYVKEDDILGELGSLDEL